MLTACLENGQNIDKKKPSDLIHGGAIHNRRPIEIVPQCQVRQYWLRSFQGRDTKLERILAKNQLQSNEIIEENYSSSKLSKIGHQIEK